MQLQRAYELLILDRRMSSSKDRNSDKPALTTFLPAQRLLWQIGCHVKAIILVAFLSLLADARKRCRIASASEHSHAGN